MGTTHDDALPEISDDVIDRIEQGVFARIAAEREDRGPTGDETRSAHRSTTSARRRRGWWIGGAAAAAVAIIAAGVLPQVLTQNTGVTADGVGVSVDSPDMSGGAAYDSAEIGPQNMPADASAHTSSAATSDTGLPVDFQMSTGRVATDRSIITTASASLTVADVEVATAAITTAATDAGGFVESMNVGSSAYPVDRAEMTSSPTTGWITVRIPADTMTTVMDGLAGVGDVVDSSIDRSDVTGQVVDLQARIDTTRASVERLTELMAQTGSVGDLITAESALSERQATLESYEQQLKLMNEQVAMSTLSVNLAVQNVTVDANPAGFGDGLVAGWNGLVAAMNGLVIALGFLLPWLVIAGVAGVVVWLVVRRRRRSRARIVDPETQRQRDADLVR